MFAIFNWYFSVYSFIIKYIESQTSDSPDPFWKGLFYCWLLLISVIVNPIIWNLMLLTNLKARLRIRSSLLSSIYQKVGYSITCSYVTWSTPVVETIIT